MIPRRFSVFAPADSLAGASRRRREAESTSSRYPRKLRFIIGDPREPNETTNPSREDIASAGATSFFFAGESDDSPRPAEDSPASQKTGFFPENVT
jgi:hypothetical protein